MEGITVQGRGFPSPVVEVTVTAAGISIRIGDELNPEAWVNVHLNGEVIEALDHEYYTQTIQRKDGAP